jgi:Zn-dependent peptidase ImmA (M78 family)/DNA-binding XRE family transcriptional regulator
VDRTQVSPDTQTIRPSMITLARESRGLTQSTLAPALGISQGHLSKIEAGMLPVTEVILHRLVAALDYPDSFFALAEPLYGPGTSEFFHRKRSSLSVRILRQLHAQVNIRRIHISRLLRSAELTNDGIPEMDSDTFGGNVEEVARAVRAAWNLSRGPVENLTQTIEDAGGIVILADFGTPLLDAVSRWVPGMPPLFFVNQEAPWDRARLTLAHELGHMVMHRVPRAEMEDEAFRFAAEFLMPERDIRSHLEGVTLDRLAALKPHWKVSMQALLRRAAGIGRITRGRERYLWMQLSTAGYRQREPVELDIPREEPQVLSELIQLHEVEFGYSTNQLAELLALHEHEAQRLYGIEQASDSRTRLRLVKTAQVS